MFPGVNGAVKLLRSKETYSASASIIAPSPPISTDCEKYISEKAKVKTEKNRQVIKSLFISVMSCCVYCSVSNLQNKKLLLKTQMPFFCLYGQILMCVRGKSVKMLFLGMTNTEGCSHKGLSSCLPLQERRRDGY